MPYLALQLKKNRKNNKHLRDKPANKRLLFDHFEKMPDRENHVLESMRSLVHSYMQSRGRPEAFTRFTFAIVKLPEHLCPFGAAGASIPRLGPGNFGVCLVWEPMPSGSGHFMLAFSEVVA